MRVHQLTYGMMMGDAISNHVLEIDARLRGWGYETAIYAQHVRPEMATCVCPDEEFVPHIGAEDDLLIYHYSMFTPNMRMFQMARGRRMLIYHNITPPEFFRGWDDLLEVQCTLGRAGLGLLADCDLALGDSEFNRQELIQAGFPQEKTGVLPIFLPQRHREMSGGNDALRAGLAHANTVNWLTVGRVVPNKAIEDVLRTFYVYNHTINPDSHLYVVGHRYIPAYDAKLDALVGALGLRDQVTFTGRVSDRDLVTYYQESDLYMVASRHEGFCVPLVESMRFGVPIIARKATAIPETLGSAGVLFTELGYEEVAEMAHMIVTDVQLRERLMACQRERLSELGSDRAERVLWEALKRLGLPVPG